MKNDAFKTANNNKETQRRVSAFDVEIGEDNTNTPLLNDSVG